MQFPDKFLLIGRGKWGKKLESFFLKNDIDYVSNRDKKIKKKLSIGKEQLINFLQNIDFDSAWIATGDEKANIKIIECLILLKKNIIVEKPLLLNQIETKKINYYCKKYKKYFYINYQYIYHPELISLLNDRGNLNNKKMSFDAIFNVQNFSKIDVKYNLGSHLLSIYFNFFPNCKLGAIHTEYNTTDQREITISGANFKKKINLKKKSKNLLKYFIENISLKKLNNIYTNVELNYKINHKLQSK
jgi:hypothetical protein